MERFHLSRIESYHIEGPALMLERILVSILDPKNSVSGYLMERRNLFFNTCRNIHPDILPSLWFGVLTDVDYVADFEKRIEFMLSATICWLWTVGLSFMERLGKVLYDYETKRFRRQLRDLTEFKMNMKNDADWKNDNDSYDYQGNHLITEIAVQTFFTFPDFQIVFNLPLPLKKIFYKQCNYLPV